MQDVLKKEYETAYKNQIEEIARKKNIQVKKIPLISICFKCSFLLSHQKVNKNQKKQEETILSDSSGNSAPYIIKELEPEISGIVISCEGAGNKVVEASVLEAVQVLFGVSANHIKVLKMEVAK